MEKNLLYIFFSLSLLLVISYLTYSATSKKSIPKFESSITSIPISTQKIMIKYTWRSNCPVSLNDLSEIKLSYWGFDHKAHQGILIVNKTLAAEVVSIFKAAYYHKFQIERMELIENFKGDDKASMEANNTSAFNCRAIEGKSGAFSQHSYGRAIDINPLINPYVKGDKVLPPTGRKYVDRTESYPGKITRNSFIYKEFTRRGWDWGGNWHDLQDYQHFEKRDNNEKR
jgi:D-alanyl-D-alanine carboxypeptidase